MMNNCFLCKDEKDKPLFATLHQNKNFVTASFLFVKVMDENIADIGNISWKYCVSMEPNTIIKVRYIHSRIFLFFFLWITSNVSRFINFVLIYLDFLVILLLLWPINVGQHLQNAIKCTKMPTKCTKVKW